MTVDLFPQSASALHGYLQAGSPAAYAVAFLGGLLTSLNPCTYPVLPVTVGYLGSRSGGSRPMAILLSASYAIGMAVTYAALGMAAALAGKMFGEATAHPLSYLAVGNACILLSLSQFGVFRLAVPGFPSGAGGAEAPGGRWWKGFLAGAGAGIVLGPCTAPVLGGLLLYVGSSGNPLFGASLMFAFALGMALPVAALGMFTGLLARLPRSGAWLSRVKNGFGAVLLLAGEYLLVEAGKRLA
ncbi:MAG: thiol:disulfide interchange protein [Deltaproteobacteria bacterium]|nr:thiol:disulfide interchange protein [Deltaproteobacteria bacterium]